MRATHHEMPQKVSPKEAINDFCEKKPTFFDLSVAKPIK